MKQDSLITTLRTALGTLAVLAVTGMAQNCVAARPVDVTVIDRDSGERLAPFSHAGRLYVAGKPGNRYGVEIRNRTGGRVLAVLSVDGVNALSGETAHVLQSGYVFDGGQRYAINGWRKSDNDVAQFVFTDLPHSYAARTGRAGNVGVIGVAIFLEKVQPPVVFNSPNPNLSGAESLSADQVLPAPAPATPAAPLSKSAAAGAVQESARAMPERKTHLGTGHGQREYDPVQSTEFERRGDTPDQVVTIYYDSRENLIARGIIPRPQRSDPQAFPASNGFVPDPRD